MTNINDAVIEETLAAITKAQTTGILSTTGIQSYDLTGAISLIPVYTPFRTSVARESSPDGASFAIWRAFVNVTASQPRATPGIDYAGNEVLFSEQDFQAAYQPVALAGLVTQDAYDFARGLTDVYAEATFQTLNQLMIAEDKLLIGGQTYALARPAAPTLVNSTSGGSLAATTLYYIGVAARTGSNYYYGGNSRANLASTTTGAGSTNSITATIAAVKGAVAYDWFFSADGATYYFVRTTTVATTVITASIAANQAVASLALPDISTVVPTYNAAADNGSGQANESNGLIASLTGDYTTAGAFTTSGTANANGAGFTDGLGAALTLSGGSVTQVENMFAAIWNAVKTSPTRLLVNSVQAQEIANLVLGSSSATTFLTTDEENRISVTAGGRIGQIVNTPAGGVTVPIEVHVSLPPGTIIAVTDRVPFPQSKISSTLAVRTLRDYSQYEYASSRVASTAGGGPRKEFEVRSVQTLINRAPVAMAILSNIA